MLDVEDITSCSICGIQEEETSPLFVKGYLGIIATGFCDTCYTGLVSLVFQLEGIQPEE